VRFQLGFSNREAAPPALMLCASTTVARALHYEWDGVIRLFGRVRAKAGVCECGYLRVKACVCVSAAGCGVYWRVVQAPAGCGVYWRVVQAASARRKASEESMQKDEL
jgi:hypothetical protein